MQRRELSVAVGRTFAIIALFATFTASSRAGVATETVLYNFGHGGDGHNPHGSLVFDTQGNLFGTTYGGGSGYGTVFELTPNGAGGWQETQIHRFNGQDGIGPIGNLIFDAAGNLYGTVTQFGPKGKGAVFELTPTGSGTWRESILHAFAGGSDGAGPVGGLVFDSAGNLYGVTMEGGVSNLGTVFELSPSGSAWREKILHSFDGTDGGFAFAGPAMDSQGNLYGTTSGENTGGGYGSVFELTPTSSGAWQVSRLHIFIGLDGAQPYSTPTLDGAGNVYVTTNAGGTLGWGNVVKLTPISGGWNETAIYSFTGGADGAGPFAGVTMDASGNLYGTTQIAGGGSGTVFRLTRSAAGTWGLTMLFRFDGVDGGQSSGGVILDGQGNLYGTASTGGTSRFGVVFEITP